MKFADLKRKSEKELHNLLFEKRNEIRELRFKVGEGQLKNVHTIKETKKVIARLLTLLKSKKIDSINEVPSVQNE